MTQLPFIPYQCCPFSGIVGVLTAQISLSEYVCCAMLPVNNVSEVFRWWSKHRVHLVVRVPNRETRYSYDLGHIVYRQHRTKYVLG